MVDFLRHTFEGILRGVFQKIYPLSGTNPIKTKQILIKPLITNQTQTKTH